jgi:adenine-specific DNA-methyltransferase
MPPKKPTSPQLPDPKVYRHKEASLALRPEIGAQAHFKKRKEPTKYRFDDSLAPELQWDALNPAREQGEALLAAIEQASTLEEAREAARKLKAMSRPFLDWSGKAERLSFEVPALPLFVHERLSTRAILDTLQKHKRDKQTTLFSDLFGAEERPLSEQVLRAYEYRDEWVNRLVLGDSLVVMNSLLRFENLGGQVQMIYMDPPYGVKFGSNFQPFVRSREVGHNDDDFMTREPETVQAYRDTWELGLHSYLTYLRDRFLLCHELLAPTGSMFVQISDENVHVVRKLLDEVFGAENAIVTIVLKKKGATTVTDPVNDFILWYSKDKALAKPRIKQLAVRRRDPEDDPKFNTLISPAGEQARAHKLDSMEVSKRLDQGWRWARVNYPIVSQHYSATRSQDYEFNGKLKSCGRNNQWRFEVPDGLDRLAAAGRLHDGGGASLGGVVFWDDWPYVAISNVWNDLKGEENPEYVVQTAWKAVERCMLMTTEPGDLVLDPTCGSGTTAFVAEKWGRRWITTDTSRVPLAIARERLLTATYDYFALQEPHRGPAGGFQYARRQNAKGDEVGGLVPRITLKSIANDEPPETFVLHDRPEKDNGVLRVTGPFTVESTIAPSEGLDEDPETPGIQADRHRAFVERMVEVLQRAPVLRLTGNESITLSQIRPPARTLALSAEALVDLDGGEAKPVAIVFGPEDGPISERLVREAWKEADLKGYSRLFVIGFGIDPKARQFVEEAQNLGSVPCVYLQATMDLTMGDLLKNMRSSQVFSICGLPDVEVHPVDERSGRKKGDPARWQVEIKKLNTFDPATMEAVHYDPKNIPAWFLDTDYNGMVFRVRQAFFPGTGSWDKLKKELRAYFEDSVWDHLAGTVSEPFEVGDHRQVAVKVIDPRGNELIVVKKLESR